MRIDVALSPDAALDAAAVAIAVDVIRATTTIAYALGQGYQEVICCPAVDDARAAAAAIGDAAVLAGEVDRLPPPGFALGNSPREFEEDSRSATCWCCPRRTGHALSAPQPRLPGWRWSAPSRT